MGKVGWKPLWRPRPVEHGSCVNASGELAFVRACRLLGHWLMALGPLPQRCVARVSAEFWMSCLSHPGRIFGVTEHRRLFGVLRDGVPDFPFGIRVLWRQSQCPATAHGAGIQRPDWNEKGVSPADQSGLLLMLRHRDPLKVGYCSCSRPSHLGDGPSGSPQR